METSIPNDLFADDRESDLDAWLACLLMVRGWVELGEKEKIGEEWVSDYYK